MKAIFITGASSGLGEGLAEHFGGPGVTLGLVARRADKLNALKSRLEERGARVLTFAVDVAVAQDMSDTINAFLQETGTIDLVIANAGMRVPYQIGDGNAEGVNQLMAVNFNGVVNTVVPFVPAMKKQKAGILCAVGSVAGFRALPFSGAYCASKAAVNVFMDSLRMDLAGTGVHAMTICPGFVATPMTASNKRMIFLLEVSAAVRLMVSALVSRKSTYTFPWQMRFLKEVMKRLPESLVRLMGRKR